MVREKYSRATGLIVRDGKVLLVRERCGRDFRLPGGRIHDAHAGPVVTAKM